MSDDEVLFEITERQLNTGLRGIPVGTCRTSSVNATDGVSYRGYPVAELAHLPSEDAIHLLLYGELPTGDQQRAFHQELRRRAVLPEGVLDLLHSLPRDGHPMEWFIAGLLALGMTGKTGDYAEDGLNCIARINAMAAAVFRIREGWGDPIPPREDLGYGHNFAHMLGCPDAHPQLGELLRMFHVLHMDHGGGNLSTFVGKATASGRADMYVSLASAMTALYGPRHGRANQETLEFVKQVGTSDAAEADAFIRKTLAEGGLVYGYGHAVLRAEDPRATKQYAFAEQHFADDPLVQTVLTLRKVVPPILKENPKIANPYPNVDAVSGSLLNAAGLKDSNYYTVLFGWSRVVGIAAQIIDEQVNFRDGKGVAIYRPRYIAEGQPERHLS